MIWRPENDLVRLVIDAPDHPQNLAPSGGSILDFAPVATTSGDQTNAFYQAAGLLPRDAVHYESWREEDQPPLGQNVADAYVAVILRGHLEGDPRVTVVTRYELRPCEPGVRVTTDLYNGAPDANTLYLADGLFWGDNTLAPFVPGEGLGFRLPDLDLLHLDRAWRQWPFLAARSQAPPDVAYAIVPCDCGAGAGFNSTTLSASGLPLAPTLSGDGLHYERFILATPGVGLAPAVGEALRVRDAGSGYSGWVAVTAGVVARRRPHRRGGRGGRPRCCSTSRLPGADPDDEAHRIPWSEAVPKPDGTFYGHAPARPELPGPALRLRAPGGAGDVVRARSDGRRYRRPDADRLGAAAGRRPEDARCRADHGDVCRAGRDSVRSGVEAARGPPSRPVSGVRPHARTAPRKDARLQPRAHRRRHVRFALAGRGLLRLRNAGALRDAGPGRRSRSPLVTTSSAPLRGSGTSRTSSRQGSSRATFTSTAPAATTRRYRTWTGCSRSWRAAST